jgi:hypothetical protein
MKSEPVPAEFRGRARVLINRLADQSQPFVQTMNDLGPKITHRLRRLKNLRPEAMQDFERRMREVAPFADDYHGFVFDRRRGTMEIATLFFSSSWLHREAWGRGDFGDNPNPRNGAEETLDMNLSTAKLTRGSIEIHARRLLSIGAHSIGRRYQRGFGDHSDDAILADLWHLRIFWKDWVNQQVASPEPLSIDPLWFEISVPTKSGTYFGEVSQNTLDAEKYPYLSVRTFHHEDYT